MNKLIARALVAGVAATALPAGAAVAADIVSPPEPCPDGYTGVVIGINGRQVQACQNLVETGSCPTGDVGISVHVAGKGVIVCVDPRDIAFSVTQPDLPDTTIYTR